MTTTPSPLPSQGGSYIRDDKGNLTPARPKPTTPTQKPAQKPLVKEG